VQVTQHVGGVAKGLRLVSVSSHQCCTWAPFATSLKPNLPLPSVLAGVKHATGHRGDGKAATGVRAQRADDRGEASGGGGVLIVFLFFHSFGLPLVRVDVRLVCATWCRSRSREGGVVVQWRVLLRPRLPRFPSYLPKARAAQLARDKDDLSRELEHQKDEYTIAATALEDRSRCDLPVPDGCCFCCIAVVTSCTRNQ
jgi:hypothetical protein